MKKRILLIPLLMLAAVVAWGFYENTRLEINCFPVSHPDLPEGFDGFRIAHISDLHDAQFGPDNADLIHLLEDLQPDIIAITGDLVDSRRTDIDAALRFAEKVADIAPCYYVPGNHEARIEQFPQLEQQLTDVGVTVLRNQSLSLERNGNNLTLVGVDDPSFTNRETFSTVLSSLASDSFTVLLSHRPEYMELYCRNGFDLVLSGHVHGGQFRLPVLGGLIAPGQGFFPEYDSGLYTQNNTNLVVSRGLGNSLFPFRLNNPPELIMITLTTQ